MQCTCLSYDAEKCAARGHHLSLAIARKKYGACHCSCHEDDDGQQISRQEWRLLKSSSTPTPALVERGQNIRQIRSYSVLLTSSDEGWNEGMGRLYEPFEVDETLYNYSVLHIAPSMNVPHGQRGYYLLASKSVETARTSGLIITDAQGNQSGFEYPASTCCISLTQAILHLSASLPLKNEGTTHGAP